MSGSVLSHFAMDKDPFKGARHIARQNNCPTNDTRRMVDCLRELPVEKLISDENKLQSIRATARDFVSGFADLLGAGPVVEGPNDRR